MSSDGGFRPFPDIMNGYSVKKWPYEIFPFPCRYFDRVDIARPLWSIIRARVFRIPDFREGIGLEKNHRSAKRRVGIPSFRSPNPGRNGENRRADFRKIPGGLRDIGFLGRFRESGGFVRIRRGGGRRGDRTRIRGDFPPKRSRNPIGNGRDANARPREKILLHPAPRTFAPKRFFQPWGGF